MQLRGSEPTAVKAEEKPKMTTRRNSFDGVVEKPKAETVEATTTKAAEPEKKQKKSPKSVNGIDNLTLAISSIKLDTDATDDKKKPTVTVMVVKKEAAKETSKSKDEEDKAAPVDLENVTESYVSSMRELLSSFDKSLQLDDEKDKTPTKKAAATPAVTSPTSPVKKDGALPLPRFLLTGGSVPVAKKAASATAATQSPKEKEEVKARPSSSTTPVVDDKEAGVSSTPTRKVRPRSTPGPSDDAHIVRSSKSALPRRRGVPEVYDGTYAVPTGYDNFSGNLIPDPSATLDSFLGMSQADYMAKQPGATSMDFYGFPDLNNTFNMGFPGIGQGNDSAVYNTGEQGFTAESTPELVECGEPGLGVYSSPAGPVTPPAGTPYSQNLLASPYTPPDLNHPTPDNNMSFNGTWSAPSSSIGSPESYMSPQMTTLNRPNPQTVHEMKRIILLPLSQEPGLIQFTPLIGAASQKLDEGQICSLRDLEKFLLYRSQEMAPNPHSFLSFCEKFLARCQQAIPYIENAGGELTRPSDEPYYEGYFLDVLTQHREAMASDASSSVPQMTILRRDPSSSISSSGSVAKKSVPVISRVTKNGSVSHVSHANINSKVHDQILAALLDQSSSDVKLPEEFYQSHLPNQLPLSPVSEDDKDDEYHQQDMNAHATQVGRRRRMTVQKPLGGHVCMHRDEESGIICGKKYNRPCDLKKHGKTHSRPHKCSEPTCLYHEKGFPTEKERDRHETDRHSDSPQMWHCEFPPCPYKSKRESNCKQHMEKQHDYVYERSKHNPRNPNGNADAAKKKAAAFTAAAAAAAKNVHTLGSSVPIVKSSVVPSSHKSNGPSIFDGGISTPPSDVYTNLFSTVPSSMPYMTPSPEASHSFRSNSIGNVKGEPDVGENTWGQYAGWGQPVMNNGMLGYGMTAE